MEVDDEREGVEQRSGVEARDVGAVALAHVEDVDERQGAHRLPEGVSRETQRLGEVGFAGQPISRLELAAEDHLLDPQDGLISQSHVTNPLLEQRG